jgi:HKD family nuclease
MRASVINQYPTQESTVDRLGALLSDFSVLENAQFRALIAFASEAGLRMLEPGLRRFLDSQHSIFWIVGVDLGGTGREALDFLYQLKCEYSGQVDVRIFSTMDNKTIFHPKVYWLDANNRKAIVIGSANVTAGGLTNNFEVSVQLDLEAITDEKLLEELEFLWMSYSSPLPPLQAGNLLEIDRALIARFDHDRPLTDGSPQQPHPLHGLIRRPPRQISIKSSKEDVPAPSLKGRLRARRSQELIMDILQETRQTQVQLPVDALTSFFGEVDVIQLRHIRGGSVIKTDVRPIIHLGNNTHRIEIDAIRGLPRPQIIIFRHPGRAAAVVNYELVLKGTRKYIELDNLLTQRGQQTRNGARRWLLR